MAFRFLAVLVPKAFLGFQRLVHALTATHRRKLSFDVARHGRIGIRVRPELDHSLSWRFGVPVR